MPKDIKNGVQSQKKELIKGLYFFRKHPTPKVNKSNLSEYRNKQWHNCSFDNENTHKNMRKSNFQTYVALAESFQSF